MRPIFFSLVLATSSCLVIGPSPAPSPRPGWEPQPGTSESGCSGDQVSCNGACRNLRYDASNCGACGRVCGETETCRDRQCISLTTMRPAPADAGTPVTQDASMSMPTPRCMLGRGDCDGNPANGCETDLFQDRNNCGTCGTVCERFCGGGGCI